MDTILGSLSGRMTQRVLNATFPALLFAAGLLLVWTDGDARRTVDALSLYDRQPAAVQTAIAVATLSAAVLAGLAMQSASHLCLRWMEGYWPAWLDAVRSRLVRRIQRGADRDTARIQALLTAQESGREYARLDRRIRRLPSAAEHFQPTRLGNILRAAETRPIDKYGIDPVVIWPHLFLCFPEDVRRELVTARHSLDRAVTALMWSLLFIAATPWAWWAAPAGLLVAAVAFRAMIPSAAQAFADLLEASIDLHRLTLYEHLHWPLPANPAEEPQNGIRLVSYLTFGADDGWPQFVDGRSNAVPGSALQ